MKISCFLLLFFPFSAFATELQHYSLLIEKNNGFIVYCDTDSCANDVLFHYATGSKFAPGQQTVAGTLRGKYLGQEISFDAKKGLKTRIFSSREQEREFYRQNPKPAVLEYRFFRTENIGDAENYHIVKPGEKPCILGITDCSGYFSGQIPDFGKTPKGDK